MGGMDGDGISRERGLCRARGARSGRGRPRAGRGALRRAVRLDGAPREEVRKASDPTNRVAPPGSWSLARALSLVAGVGLLPTDVHQHRPDLADGDRDLEADLPDRLGLARGRGIPAQLPEELRRPLALFGGSPLRAAVRP